MKKILYIHHGTSKGGAPRSLAFLIEKLDKTKYSPIVLCMKDRKNIDFFKSVGADVIFDESLYPFHGSVVSGMNSRLLFNNLLYALPSFKKAKKYFMEIKPDMVHLNSSCLFVYAYASKIINPDCKVICHIREPLLDNYFGNILRYFSNKYVDGFISIDQFDLDNMCVKKAKSKVVYNFVNIDIYNSQIKSQCLRQELGLFENDIIFLFLARIIKSNGAFELINVCKNYIKSNPNYKFVFVGDKNDDNSKYTRNVRNLVREIDNCYLLPFRSDIPDVIASSDVLICPFTEPHFARAIVEGAAMRKPAIGSNIGGVNELIRNNETGILYNNTEELEWAIKSFGENRKLREEMGAKAEQYALENFNSIINAKQIMDFYDSI
ncbi:hypothetical protein WQ54_05340 [Bacillus sp. SA1-12]|uniref:glycosyltransferase n=1 Tax=Bacillus sp. SA1-12 TaxID=1455638 RepID=UPI000625E03E|nr:glycosyltransferase [Bacillus sp. SA1-12]KKI93260.1 hypothetical protein WQ54_05340 [Bacillus sp. SA1-12]